jgi:hypothetical protein
VISWSRWRKPLLVGAFILACLATLIAIFYAVENWRGRRAWNRYAQELRAKGQPLYFSELAPAPIPDAENFAATPYLAAFLESRESREAAEKSWPDQYKEAANLVDDYEKSLEEDAQSKERWKRMPLEAWEAAFAQADSPELHRALQPQMLTTPAQRSQSASNILVALRVYEPILEELQNASKRPFSRYNIDYEAENPLVTLLPHYQPLRQSIRVLELRSAARLAAGQTELAWQDIRLMLTLADSLREEPVLISSLVRIALVRLSLRAFWEGLAEEIIWSEAQLLEMQERCLTIDFSDLPRSALVRERAMGNKLFDYIRGCRGVKELTIGLGLNAERGDDWWAALFFTKCPRGWLYFEQLNYNRFFDAFVFSTPASSGPRIDPKAIDQKTDAFMDFVQAPVSNLLKHRLLSTLVVPALAKIYFVSAEGQADIDMASLACALERYHLAKGDYPDELQALQPEFMVHIPDDVVASQPYQYRKLGGRFLLYSIGWDTTDDQGQPGENREAGDWSWRYPTSQGVQ